MAVSAVPLSSLLEGVDLFKLDVEGQEYDLLSSEFETLKSQRPTIILELLDVTPRLRSLVLALCNEAGYRCYNPTRRRLVEMSSSEVSTGSVVSRRGVRDVVLTCDPLCE
jgi:hypothetical protein